MAAAVFGLAGTLLGAVLALVGSSLADRRQARRDDLRWRREQRETAYAETLRYLLRVNRIYGANYSEVDNIQDDSDWISDLLEAQFWLRTLTIRCKPEQSERVNLLALRLDEAVNMTSSDFKKRYMMVIIQACVEGLNECARSDVGLAAASKAAIVAPTQNQADGYLG